MYEYVGFGGGVKVAVAAGVSVNAGVEVNVGSGVDVSVGGGEVRVGVSVGSGVNVLVGGTAVSVGGAGVMVGTCGAGEAHAARICRTNKKVIRCRMFFFIQGSNCIIN
jgi:hypothetical protein